MRNLGLQQTDELRIHELVFIRDIKANDSSLHQMGFELGRELGAVRALHDEDDVRPLQQLRRNRVVGVGFQAGRGRLDTGPVCKDLLGGRATEPVLATDEKNIERHEFLSAV